MKTIAIVEGWAGGPKLSRKFRDSLKESGFRLTKNLSDADVIFAHSTGCYMIPAQIKAALVIATDPPYWPDRSIVGRWLDLLKTDSKLLRSGAGSGSFISKKLWELYYIVAKPGFSWSVFKNQSHLDFLNKHSGTKILLVRNQEDEFCSPKVQERLKKYKNVRYIELPGNHEDYYNNPRPYVKLIQSEYGRR